MCFIRNDEAVDPYFLVIQCLRFRGLQTEISVIFSIFKKVDKESNNTIRLILVGSARLILLQAIKLFQGNIVSFIKMRKQ